MSGRKAKTEGTEPGAPKKARARAGATDGKPPRRPARKAARGAPEAVAPAEGEVVEAEGAEDAPVEALEPAAEELAEVEAQVGDADADAAGDVVEAVGAPGTGALVRAGAVVPLSQRDPLASYMAEVRRHPLLTREEELRLAREYRDTGNLKAAYRLVASNLRLVVKLAHEYHRNPLSLLDLVQEGNIGLMQAVRKYDPERGVKLSSYAAWWIRAYILRYIMDNWKMVKLGTTEAQRKLFFKLRQEQDRLVQQGFEPSPKLLAERLNVTEQDVVEMDQRLGSDEMSLDAPVSDDDRHSRAERMLPSGQQGADDALGNAQLKALFREKLAEFARGLEGKERYIFEKRLMADEPMTLQEIGDQYGVSRERARQIEAALIGRMKEFMREAIPDFDLVAVPKD